MTSQHKALDFQKLLTSSPISKEYIIIYQPHFSAIGAELSGFKGKMLHQVARFGIHKHTPFFLLFLNQLDKWV